MKHVWRMFAALVAVVALGVGTGVALADHGSGGAGSGRGDGGGGRAQAGHGQSGKGGETNAAKQDRHGKHRGGNSGAVEVYRLDGGATHGNPEGIAFDRRSGDFFVSATGDGSIWRGELGNTADLVPTFIAGVTGNSATGMKISRGKLYVSGASTGTIKVYDVASGALLATFDTKGGNADPTFINDLVVTRRGDVYATDSFRAAIYHLTAAEIASGSPDAVTPIDPEDVIDTSPEIPFDAGENVFNLNGIVSTGRHGRGDTLIVVNTKTGQLFVVHVPRGDNADRTIDELTVDGGPFPGGDGLLIDRGRLLVVQGSTADFPNGVVSFIKLKHGGRRGELDDQRSDPSLRGPSTIARARDEYLIVNADFATSTTPFTVTGLPR